MARAGHGRSTEKWAGCFCLGKAGEVAFQFGGQPRAGPRGSVSLCAGAGRNGAGYVGGGGQEMAESLQVSWTPTTYLDPRSQALISTIFQNTIS